MKIKTAELTGAALDWAVAMAEGHKPPLLRILRGNVALPDPEDPMVCDYLEYSTVWDLGGPIIEREQLWVIPEIGHEGTDGAWTVVDVGGHTAKGPTPLVAAMRCFAASKFGDEVEIPEGLLS